MTAGSHRDAGPALFRVEPTRREAAVALVVLTTCGLALRAWHLGFGLPLVLHTDYSQVEQAADLLATGGFTDRAPYPTLNVFVLALLDAAFGLVARVTGWTELLPRPETGHLIARGWSALAGALLAPATYRLARIGLSRGPALVAAAAAVFCPIAVATSHLARIHAPGVTLLVLAAVPALRFVLDPSRRRALVAGAAAGLTAGFIQLGLLLAAATVLQLALAVRPLALVLKRAALYGLVAGAVFVALEQMGHVLADIEPGYAGGQYANALTLGIPTVTLGLHYERLPQLVATWIASEPVRAGLVMLFLASVLRVRRSPQPLLLYGVYPAVVLLILGSNYTQARYVLSLTPFLAPLAVLGLQSVRPAVLRTACAALLLAWPLAVSIRYDQLLAVGDTRLRLARALARLPDAGGTVLIEDALLPQGAPTQPWVRRFPENSNYLPWSRGETTREQSFAQARPVIFVRDPSKTHRPPDPLLLQAGLRRVGSLGTGYEQDSTFPDPTEAMSLDVWRAWRTGPNVEVWSLPGEAASVARQLVEL